MTRELPTRSSPDICITLPDGKQETYAGPATRNFARLMQTVMSYDNLISLNTAGVLTAGEVAKTWKTSSPIAATLSILTAIGLLENRHIVASLPTSRSPGRTVQSRAYAVSDLGKSSLQTVRDAIDTFNKAAEDFHVQLPNGFPQKVNLRDHQPETTAALRLLWLFQFDTNLDMKHLQECGFAYATAREALKNLYPFVDYNSFTGIFTLSPVGQLFTQYVTKDLWEKAKVLTTGQ